MTHARKLRQLRQLAAGLTAALALAGALYAGGPMHRSDFCGTHVPGQHQPRDCHHRPL